MINPEIKVGQKYRVVDPVAFGYSGVTEGEVLTVQSFEEPFQWHFSEHVFMYPEEVTDGVLELVEDVQEPTEASEDVSEPPYCYAPEESENVSRERTEASTAIRSGHSAELLWKFIEASPGYNGHKQFEIDELTFECLKEVVESLGEYLEDDRDVVANTLEIRLMYNGDSGKFAGTWYASVYQLDYWDSGEHPCGHTDRLLLGVEIVKGI